MNGHIFADSIMVADRKRAAWLMDLKVLGSATNHGPFTNAVVATESRARPDDSSGFQRAVVAKNGSLFNNAKGTDRDVVAKFCTRINQGRGVNLSHGSFSSSDLGSLCARATEVSSVSNSQTIRNACLDSRIG